MSKKGKLKKAYEEKVNKRKSKPNPICKVHKGKHRYDTTLEEHGFSWGTKYDKVMVIKQCACGKKDWIYVPVVSGKLLKKLVEHIEKHPDIEFWDAVKKLK